MESLHPRRKHLYEKANVNECSLWWPCLLNGVERSECVSVSDPSARSVKQNGTMTSGFQDSRWEIPVSFDFVLKYIGHWPPWQGHHSITLPCGVGGVLRTIEMCSLLVTAKEKERPVAYGSSVTAQIAKRRSLYLSK